MAKNKKSVVELTEDEILFLKGFILKEKAGFNLRQYEKYTPCPDIPYTYPQPSTPPWLPVIY
jgi:hypothetical protein